MKSVRLYLIAAAIGLIASPPAVLVAAEISQHDRQDMALLKAIQLCQAKGGQFSWSMQQRFRLIEDAQGYRILGNELVVLCAEKPAATVTRTWAHPTKRKDGSPLAPSEIRGYQITVDGAVTMLAPVTEYTLDSTVRSATIRTVDSNGIQSDPVVLR